MQVRYSYVRGASLAVSACDPAQQTLESTQKKTMSLAPSNDKTNIRVTRSAYFEVSRQLLLFIQESER